MDDSDTQIRSWKIKSIQITANNKYPWISFKLKHDGKQITHRYLQ